jgi:glycosyltransferase involved in cell wall biosynthesis/Flp pilus assembly protein TadD
MTGRSIPQVRHGLPSLREQASRFDNDYSQLELEYRRVTGGELVSDPNSSPRYGPSLTLSASVIIPAWNARDTLPACIAALENSSFNQRYSGQLEIVVVDDGSTDGTWELLSSLTPGVNFKAVRQAHHSRAHAQNTAIAVAEGDVVISCDADMVLSVFAVEELVKRHQVLDNVMLLGFRGDIQRADERIDPPRLPRTLPELTPPFARDVRLNYGSGAWPDNMCRDTQHLKRLGHGKQLIMPDGGRWDLAGLVYGALFSLQRDAFALMDGYDERFVGWGCEDTLVGVRAQAMSLHIVPVFSAAGWHIAHTDRSGRKWQEFQANRRVFKALMEGAFLPGEGRFLSGAPYRIQTWLTREPARRGEPTDLEVAQLYLNSELADHSRRGKHLHLLGRYVEAADAFACVEGAPEDKAWAAFDGGKSLSAGGAPAAAIPLLTESAGRLPHSAWPLVELASAYAALGDFARARRAIQAAAVMAPTNPAVDYILRKASVRHLERGAFYARQDDHILARRDFEAALMVNPVDISALLGRTASLVSLGDAGAAKVTLESARRLAPGATGIAEQRVALANMVARLQPLPYARSIAEQTQSIPGWFGVDEAELLVALTLRAASAAAGLLTIVEIGSYCGRATATMALALRGIGRTARILAVAEPTLGLAPDGRDPTDVLQDEVDRLDLRAGVVCAPKEDSRPWQKKSHLLLVDGRHDLHSIRDDLGRFLPSLTDYGLLVFHDYADYFPDVQRVVDELLLDSPFAYVAHVGSLIALIKRPDSEM